MVRLEISVRLTQDLQSRVWPWRSQKNIGRRVLAQDQPRTRQGPGGLNQPLSISWLLQDTSKGTVLLCQVTDATERPTVK